MLTLQTSLEQQLVVMGHCNIHLDCLSYSLSLSLYSHPAVIPSHPGKYYNALCPCTCGCVLIGFSAFILDTKVNSAPLAAVMEATCWLQQAKNDMFAI